MNKYMECDCGAITAPLHIIIIVLIIIVVKDVQIIETLS